MSYVDSSKYARKDDPAFVVAAARCFYVNWYLSDEKRERSVSRSGAELTEVVPETQRWAFRQARDFARLICLKFRGSLRYDIFLPYIIEEWRKTWDEYRYSDRESTDENMGWYAAMQALGQGVNLHDFGIDVDIPCMEAAP